MSNLSKFWFFVKKNSNSLYLQYKINSSSLWSTVELGSLGGLFPCPQLVFTLGFYTFQAVIWRSILSAGSVDLPFVHYPISFGKRCFYNYSITFPGFLPIKRMFQSSIASLAPHLICTILSTALNYSKFYTNCLVFLVSCFVSTF
jgi:hypothetical protein